MRSTQVFFKPAQRKLYCNPELDSSFEKRKDRTILHKTPLTGSTLSYKSILKVKIGSAKRTSSSSRDLRARKEPHIRKSNLQNLFVKGFRERVEAKSSTPNRPRPKLSPQPERLPELPLKTNKDHCFNRSRIIRKTKNLKQAKPSRVVVLNKFRKEEPFKELSSSSSSLSSLCPKI